MVHGCQPQGGRGAVRRPGGWPTEGQAALRAGPACIRWRSRNHGHAAAAAGQGHCRGRWRFRGWPRCWEWDGLRGAAGGGTERWPGPAPIIDAHDGAVGVTVRQPRSHRPSRSRDGDNAGNWDGAQPVSITGPSPRPPGRTTCRLQVSIRCTSAAAGSQCRATPRPRRAIGVLFIVRHRTRRPSGGTAAGSMSAAEIALRGGRRLEHGGKQHAATAILRSDRSTARYRSLIAA